MTNTKKIKNGTVLQSTCVVCGGVLIQTGKRPPTACSTNCRDVTKFMSALEKRLDLVKWKDADKRKRILGDLLSMVNVSRGKRISK